MGLASLSGLLLGLGFPGLLPVPWLMFVGWLPMLALAQASRQAARPLRDFWPYAWLGLMLWNILSTYWVANAALAAGLFAIIVNSLLMLLPWLGWLLSSRAMPRLGYVPLVAYWLTGISPGRGSRWATASHSFPPGCSGMNTQASLAAAGGYG
jgi:apolipoprotein N-acyltransferase